MKSYCWDRERDAGSSSSAIVAESRVGSELASADVLESHTSICATTMRPFLSASRSEGTMSPKPAAAGRATPLRHLARKVHNAHLWGEGTSHTAMHIEPALSFQIALFGRVQLTGPDGEIELTSKKLAALLAYLILT